MFEYQSYDDKTILARNLKTAAKLIGQARKIIVVTGAGISVSSGIPDFRSKDGIYAKIKDLYPEITDANQLFNIDYFRADPVPFFTLLKDVFMKKTHPSPSHKFVKLLEDRKQLLRNYTQNVDSLEKAAGIHNVVECHGTLETATCIDCGYETKKFAVKPSVMQNLIPFCPECIKHDKKGVLKPDIVFFGEDLPTDYRKALENDKLHCDLLLVIGSSLSVHPVASLPRHLRRDVPKILINKNPVTNIDFDLQLIGDSDEISNTISRLLQVNY